MKIKFNKKNVGSEGITVATASGGALLSRGVMSLIPVNKKSTLISGGIALASVLAVASIEGKGHGETALRGVFAGVAIDQVVSTLTEAIKPSITEVTEESSKKDKFVAAMFGLNGADESQPYIIPSEAWDGQNSKTTKKSDTAFSADKVASV